jgi:DNA repair exonuclease SbcCD nuclease subunit
MTRVIHTGDTHLGYQQYHRPERREDFLDAFRQVATDAIEDDAEAVVHAGDLFHDRRPTLPDIMGAMDVLRTLDDAKIPFLAVVGNHEAKRDAQWLDLYESLGLATRLGTGPVTVGGVAFYGLDFVPRAKRPDLDYEFATHDADYAALVSHGLFQPFPHGDWDAQEVLASASVDFDAVLLGDDHTPRTKLVEDPHDAWLTYCGSTERASTDERDERGYNVVVFDEETSGAAGVDVRRRGLDTREFVFVDVELGDGEGVERVRERVGQYDLDDAVVSVSIEGEGDPVTPASIEEYADEQGALVARVADHRELTDESEVEVSFADPDEAVRERIRDLGLSPAARELDETIRASKVADSNVADAVEERVREFAEDADAGAFEGVDGDADGGDDTTTEADESGTEPAAASTDAAATPADDEGTASDGDAEDTPPEDAETAAEGEPAGAATDSTESGSSDGDGQVTMEDYL